MAKKTALISVSDKTGIVDFARKIARLGFEIVSTGGTARLLKKNKIPVVAVDSLTEFPEILGGRVKTLHPKIFGGILARGSAEHSKDLKKHGIRKIDLVVVNLYPFADTIAKKNCTLEKAVEEIDIGGVSLLRAAAKNFERVTVVCDPAEYASVATKLKKGLKKEERKQFAATAFAHTKNYDELISEFLAGKNSETAAKMPRFEFAKSLRYGENPHQPAALFHEIGNDEPNVANAKVLNGKELSFNNLMDADFAFRIPADFRQPTAAVIKHANPCGVASASKIETALALALAADEKSPFGGIIALNRPVNAATAKIITSLFTEVVVAPKFEPAALRILKQKKNLRLLETGDCHHETTAVDFKKIGGGVLVQSLDNRTVTAAELKVVTKKAPTKKQIADLVFAANVCRHAKSNAIVIACDRVAIGIGAGQTARVDAAEIAIAKAGTKTSGAVLASDAFFPFADSIDVAARAGIAAIIQPGGSIRDAEVIAAADAANIAMVFSGVRGFRH